MAFGAKDARGIFQFGEDDAEATFSQLLNLGMQSVSDATRYFSGTPAQRAALIPAPDGAIWQDTDTAGVAWRGVGGAWLANGPEVFDSGNFSVDTGIALQRQKMVVNHDTGFVDLYLAITGVTGTARFLGYLTRAALRPIHLDAYPVGVSTSAGVATTGVGSIRIRPQSAGPTAGEMWYYGPASPTAVFVNVRYLFK